ncbi:putative lysine-specific demethylase JMJ16 [Rutidosis leptorrhynchoides]|uniref:putative lysine-specific demethylase JMJ16 n=1 Tax=Rutidosis leptorrhynchoides TaxID=125765 RepID=UPI003A98D107
MSSEKRKDVNDHVCLKLKRIERNELPESTHDSFDPFDIQKLQKSLTHKPWILHNRAINSAILDCEHVDHKVTAHLRSDEACKLELDSAPVFRPTKEEFENIVKYIAKIRQVAERFGICSIVPPDSWQPNCRFKESKIWETFKFQTKVQQISNLQISKFDKFKRANRDLTMELDYRRDGFECRNGPEFSLQTFKEYADDFEARYFEKHKFGTPVWENIENEYWRIVQNPTENIQILAGNNLDSNVFGDGFSSLEDDRTECTKSGWKLDNAHKLPGSLHSFDSDGSAGLSTRVDIGMCFSSHCWKVEEHNLYSLNYLSIGASRIWYGVPGKYNSKCEAAMNNLFRKHITQVSPSYLQSEGIPVYRCVQYPKQFVLIFPGAYSSGFNSGFNVCTRVNLTPFDWLPYGNQSVEIYSELHRKTLISYDKLLIEGCRDTVLKLKRDSEEWKVICGTDGWLSRALKSRVKHEHLRREYFCNAAQSRIMDKHFCSLVKKECVVCYYDLYLSAASCSCCPERNTCLEHSKQLCLCPWSSRIFMFRYTMDELNLLVNALEGKLNALFRWAQENRQLFVNDRKK